MRVAFLCFAFLGASSSDRIFPGISRRAGGFTQDQSAPVVAKRYEIVATGGVLSTSPPLG